MENKNKYPGYELGDYAYEKERIKEEAIGEDICPVCGDKSKLIKRKGYLWECRLSICTGKIPHRCVISEKVDSKYSVGDHIRIHESTFAKESRIILNSFREGVITKVYTGIGGYYFDFVVKRQVIVGDEIPDTSWAIGQTVHGIRHSDRCVTLL
ncbi:hypothetical protein bpr_II090 (plasmid) [Butyrivibrio proteoclasticus B316]|uniref:Uncharacterized protein n=1 Tax=Butyrivibrio proteoclasticus (strain ATCC 51982 / DSM 14932 / B316) TaxID=515622 RepID=E0S3P7_BUTPB|nr:hypothetical protein bpr_II090 [Butyrivibrio proteoclasticus B316]